MFESMVLKKMFGCGGSKEQDAALCMLNIFMIFALHQVLSGLKKSRNWAGHVSCKREKRKA